MAYEARKSLKHMNPALDKTKDNLTADASICAETRHDDKLAGEQHKNKRQDRSNPICMQLLNDTSHSFRHGGFLPLKGWCSLCDQL